MAVKAPVGEPGVDQSSEATTESSRGLHIIIVGAGIGGYSAALALRQASHGGHKITILEQSPSNPEFGAAIHLAPNANGLLKRMGLRAEEAGAVELLKMTQIFPDGATVSQDMGDFLKQWEHKWLLAHRRRLHGQLEEHALDSKGPGNPPKILTGVKVVEVDPKLARVRLQNGQLIQGDIVVGADGVHSITRSAIPGGDLKPFCEGPDAKAAFRFLLERETARQDPVTAPLVAEMGEARMWYAVDRRIIMYPTSDNQILNFVGIHPMSETLSQQDDSEAWGNGGSVKKMIEVFKSFDPAVLSLIGKADASTLRVWKLLDMATMPSWTSERLVLIGDAAHPFLPHMGQGGACAIEDAIALSVMLPGDTKPGQIEERLKLYEKARITRASTLQQDTRNAGRDLKGEEKHVTPERLIYCFSHDEYEHSQQLFKEYQEGASNRI